MSFLLKDVIHASLADSIYNEIASRRSSYYYFIGKVKEWSAPNNPDTPLSTYDYEYETRNDILYVKRIGSSDVSYVVPRIDWSRGTIYDQYNPNYSSTNLSSSGASSLKDSLFYVLTGTNNVYKCINNNNGAPSLFEPFGSDLTPSTYPDGYVWKYLYTIPVSLKNRFLTPALLPVQKAISNAFYSNGEINKVLIDSPGSGYLGNSYVNLNVVGEFLGRPGNVIANLRPVFSMEGKFLDVIIENPGANYKNASIVIDDLLYSGYSYYKGVREARIFAPGTGYSLAAISNTTVTISTTGNSQPTANAQANLIFNSNCLVGVEITNPGAGYLSNVKANTSITISTSGAVQPTSNASANLLYNTNAELVPVIYNGTIDRVLIKDPGIGYSSNNQTIITTIGDGSGAVLTPFINAQGQMEEVIIESRGSGYTYIDIEVVGNGTGATAHADLSFGDLDTKQSQIEVSALDGAVHAFVINDVGFGYSYANVTLEGDGSGFIGNVVISNANTIQTITVTNPGSSYKFANVIITGDGSNAKASAIISPPGGHGSNPVKELLADTLMFFTTINNEKNQGITVNNDYRQFGIIKDPKKFDSNLYLGNLTASSCMLVTLDNVDLLNADDVLVREDLGVNKTFDVVEIVSDTNQVLIGYKNNVLLDVNDTIVNPVTNSLYNVLSVDKLPSFNKFSGDLFYIDNRTSVSYSDQQLVTLRTVLKL